MPVSKHRRKPGGRSLHHPGRGKALTRPLLPPDVEAWRKFRAAYAVPFFEATEGQDDAHCALDIITEYAWQYNDPMLAVSKATVLREMSEPIEGHHPGRTAEEAERALALLVEHGMIEVNGDQITIPARFQPVDEAR
jgi:hypothetical protein